MQAGRRPTGRLNEAREIARELWRRATASVRQTLGLLTLSLLMAIALWVFVTDAENPVRVDLFPASIAVEAVNAGAAGRPLAVANELPAVQVRISAPEDRWERLTTANLDAFVDLSGLPAGEHELTVRVDVDGIGGVRVIGTVPPSVTVVLEDFVSATVAVVPRIVGSVPPGYEIVSAAPERESVEVSGPRSLVALVRVAQAEIDVSGLTLPLGQSVRLVPQGAGAGDIRGVEVNPPSVRVVVDVEQTLLTRTVPLAAAVTGEVADGYRVTSVRALPGTVVLRGTLDVLQAIDTLLLPAVDISGAESQLTQTVTVSAPEGIAPVSITATVIVEIVVERGSLRLSLAPEVVGQAPGLVPYIDGRAVVVVLEGPLPLLNALATADVQVTVDAEGLAAGTAELDVTVETPDGLVVLSVQPRTLSVTLEPPQ